MTYRILVSDRKEVVRKLEELAGETPVYSPGRQYAYVLRGIVIGKDGMVTTEDDADLDLLRGLMNAGLIEGDAPEEPVEAEPVEAEEVPEANCNLVKPSISFPLSKHTADSLRNLVFSIYSRGKLLSKATGGTFSVSDEVVNSLKGRKDIYRIEQVIEIIRDAGEEAVQGLSFDEDKVSFDGFPETDDQMAIKAWTELSAAINKNAIRQKSVQVKAVDDTNEKFAFRTWLTRLGMNGPELKAERNQLYKNLSGHVAFRTPEDGEKWRARQKAKRDELRAQKMAAETEE